MYKTDLFYRPHESVSYLGTTVFIDASEAKRRRRDTEENNDTGRQCTAAKEQVS